MAAPDQEAIATFMNITGVDEADTVRRLEDHHGNLNAAVNAYFSEGDRNLTQEASLAAPLDDMDIDDSIPLESHRPPASSLPLARDLNPFSLLDPNFTRNIFDIGSAPAPSPFVSHPREVKEIPIEVKDGIGASSQSGGALKIEDVTETAREHGPEIRETAIIDDKNDEKSSPNSPITQAVGPSAPTIVDVPDYGNEIEEEMIRAAIEASKQDASVPNQLVGDHLDAQYPSSQPGGQSHQEDADLAHAVSLSLQTAEREKALREQEGNIGTSEVGQISSTSPEEWGRILSNGRQSQLEHGGTSLQDEADDVEELPLVRHRRRRVSSGLIDTANNIEEDEVSPPSSPPQHDHVHDPQHDRSEFPSEVWGGISSEEHDEAVMLEAAIMGISYEPHQLMRNGLGTAVDPYPWRMPRPPSPSLAAQRLIREQQDDEYLAALQADREKELKAKEEAEAALAEEKRKEDELRRKQLEEEEVERQLAAKEASLPQEPTAEDENAVTLLVRMPDGTRRGRRFLKSDKLQFLFDFIDVGRVVKSGSYRLVRPYPRHAFSDGESTSSLHDLGLTSKQEALYLELI
ncbi:UBX domain-containing family protein [Striga asiatica]|uniref:UBX domain-containing family protein n=1 Tax=Striga asiatica TaxID=4170 RepID=A0A5A7QHZ0_STRAF|nr:UBX domain-containing family protein [Striga asiatica]